MINKEGPEGAGEKTSEMRLSQPYLGNKTHAITYQEFGKMIEMIVCQTDDNNI